MVVGDSIDYPPAIMGERVGMLGLLACVAACTPAEIVHATRDAGATDARADARTADVLPAGDRPNAPGDVADAGPVRCAADRDCSGGVCDLGTQRCVECLETSQCTGGRTCLGARCVSATACTSTRMCPGQVCSARLGVCVDCDANTDCTMGQVCRRNLCVPPPRACTSGRECSDLGQVCDTTRRICVECVGDNDCAPEQFCGPEQLCLRDVCVAGATRCADLVSQMTCDARGVTETATRCPTGQMCRGTRCEATNCTPGATRCASNGMLETCAMDGGGYTASMCGSQQTCSGGRCMTWMCTPGARVCPDTTRYLTCAADGLTATSTPCGSGEACSMGRCVMRVCAPGAASCADATTRRVCNPDGLGSTDTPCGAGSTCAGGMCSGQVCVPGSATCGTTPGTRNLCNPEGTGTTVVACPVPANAAGATCVSGGCGFTCRSGFGDCDGAASNGCETPLTSESNCGICGRTCASGQTCSVGRCLSQAVPGYSGVLGPDYSSDGWRQCVGILDRRQIDDLPNMGWANQCIGAGYRRLRLACGVSRDSVRYVDVVRNIFMDPLTERPQRGLINGSNFGFSGDDPIWANDMNPNLGMSWWLSSAGCTGGENIVGLNINSNLRDCNWDVGNCFGQGIIGERYFFVYVGE